jgi:hypothetical protein
MDAKGSGRDDTPADGGSPIERAERLIDGATEAGLTARALGGIAVAIRCPSARVAPLKREYHDLDIATTRSHSQGLSDFLEGEGFQGNDRFNALHGRSRMIFTAADGLHLDVLIGEFAMCHRLDLSKRLEVDPRTLGLADLLLTKLQIAELNRKDTQDLAALLLDYPLTEDEEGINAGYVADLLARDWGWWRTVTANFGLFEHHLPALEIPEPGTATILQRLDQLRQGVEAKKKSFAWRSRAKLGDRIAWRAEPEEVASN